MSEYQKLFYLSIDFKFAPMIYNPLNFALTSVSKIYQNKLLNFSSN